MTSPLRCSRRLCRNSASRSFFTDMGGPFNTGGTQQRDSEIALARNAANRRFPVEDRSLWLQVALSEETRPFKPKKTDHLCVPKPFLFISGHVNG
ncbi:unnamed protein product [Tetraodon nigroviridis]|uniref:(spotted green pufferfish) hypothetical protein n=1 Tax=Tetraodon nigroviridis TaxID=99883 RepID=Q4S448_TETNG|nr:unnamed protein product [Tetraodon nigroviridis]